MSLASKRTPKPIYERLAAIVTVLERLASDMEVLQKGLEGLHASLPQEYACQRDLLLEQAEAVKRVSIGLGMVQDTVAALDEIRDAVRIVMDEAQTLIFVKNGLDTVLASGDLTEDWQFGVLKRAKQHYDGCITRLRKTALMLTDDMLDVEKRAAS